MKPATRKLALALLTLLALANIGCGARTTARPGSTSSASIGLALEEGIAECNQFSASGGEVSGQIALYGGTDDSFKIRLNGLTDKFNSSQGAKIQIFKWKALPSGETVLESGASDLRVEQSGGSPISGIMNEITASDVNRMRSQYGIGGTTAKDFFRNVDIVVTNVDFSWHALKVVVYEGGNALGAADVLLPPFTANVNKYAKDHPQVLQELHPLYAYRSQAGWTDADFAARANGACF